VGESGGLKSLSTVLFFDIFSFGVFTANLLNGQAMFG
jgi:hypothetical protein